LLPQPFHWNLANSHLAQNPFLSLPCFCQQYVYTTPLQNKPGFSRRGIIILPPSYLLATRGCIVLYLKDGKGHYHKESIEVLFGTYKDVTILPSGEQYALHYLKIMYSFKDCDAGGIHPPNTSTTNPPIYIEGDWKNPLTQLFIPILRLISGMSSLWIY
jgi:hypothetical protein